MAKKIVIAEKVFGGENFEKIKALATAHGYEAVFETEPLKVAAEIPDAEVILGLGRKVLDGTTESLKWLCTPSAGFDWFIKSPYRPEHEITLTNTPDVFGTAVAEHAVMMLLQLFKREPEYQQIIKDRSFKHDLWSYMVIESRIAVLGTGDLGRQVARRLRAFEPACIIGVNRSGRDAGDDFDRIVRQDDVDSILSEVDGLVMCLPATVETNGFINTARMEMMPDDSVIVNVGRGNAIVQDDLIKALTNGTIRAAALDVFESEPLKADDPIYDCPNLLMTPHCAGNMVSDHTIKKAFEAFYGDLQNYLEGRPLNNVVDLEAGY